MLPRLGADGVLVDMEYLARIGEPGQTRTGAEVWLGPAAPLDVVDKMRAAGLQVLSVRDFDTEYARAAGGPNSIGLQFLLAVSVLCLAVGAGGFAVAATVEMRSRADELRALRAQGASGPVVGRAARQSYVSIVIAGTVLGVLGAAVAWLLTRGRLPVMDPRVSGVTAPTWPGLTPLWAWLGGTAALIAVALVLSATLAAAVRNPVRRTR